MSTMGDVSCNIPTIFPELTSLKIASVEWIIIFSYAASIQDVHRNPQYYITSLCPHDISLSYKTHRIIYHIIYTNITTVVSSRPDHISSLSCKTIHRQFKIIIMIIPYLFNNSSTTQNRKSSTKRFKNKLKQVTSK